MTYRGRKTGKIVPLPDPDTGGKVPLERTLARRRSVREFGDRPLTAAQLSQLLWAAQGITGPEGLRTAPSAGGLYPLEIYVVTGNGLFHYRPQKHQLHQRSQRDLRDEVARVALDQATIVEAPATFVIAAVYRRTIAKYGEEHSPAYVHMEIGHAAQNLLLQAVALGLGAVPIAAFAEDRLQAVLALPERHLPLYLVSVGHPR